VRTVQRWQKETGEARNIARSTPGLRISVRGIATEQQRAANARAFRERVQEQGLDVAPCRVLVKVYNEPRPRPRNIGPQHIGGTRSRTRWTRWKQGTRRERPKRLGTRGCTPTGWTRWTPTSPMSWDVRRERVAAIRAGLHVLS